MNSEPRERSRRLRGSALSGATALLVVVIVAAAALARTSEGVRVTRSLGIRTQPEPFTALSFTHPGNLGTIGVVYHGPEVHDRVGFVIRNEEHRSVRYSWRVSFRPATRSYRGRVVVGASRSVTLSPRVRLPCNQRVGPSHRAPHRVQVQVRIAPSGDRIDFWQTCGG